MQRVEAHNVRRQNHVDTDDVTADLYMACEATKYAEYLLGLGYLQHASSSDRRNKGENLAMMMSSDLTPDNYVPEEQWYEGEIGFYDWNTHQGVGGVTGHFTAMVWRSTTSIGCGVASEVQSWGGQAVYSVCRYDPQGNITNAGYYEANVGQLI